MTKRKRKTTITILILLLICSNLFWLFAVFDQAVTLTYTKDSYRYSQSNYEQLLELADKGLIGMSADEVIELVGTDGGGLKPFLKEGCLFFDQVCLRLDSNNVIEGFGKHAQ